LSDLLFYEKDERGLDRLANQWGKFGVRKKKKVRLYSTASHHGLSVLSKENTTFACSFGDSRAGRTGSPRRRTGNDTKGSSER
jgi:hypothetical protein